MAAEEFSFSEVIGRIESFHGYQAPGAVVGAYMIKKAQSLLPKGLSLHAIVETSWCLPDAVQLFTGCTVGNGRLKIFPLGLYALTLYSPADGRGQRVWLDPARLESFPGLQSWLLKLTPKREQDSAALIKEIEAADISIYSSRPVRVRPEFLAKRHKGAIVLCPLCGQAYPESDGGVCRFCQGEGPYAEERGESKFTPRPAAPPLRAVPLEEAVGKKTIHDMTRIVPGCHKGAAFKRGHEITAEDLPRLREMGREMIYVEESAAPELAEWVHEDEAAEAFARAMAGEGVEIAGPPSEGKVTLTADREGLLVVEEKRLESFNLIPDVMCASRQSFSVVKAGARLAGTRAIPLYLRRELFERAMSLLREGPLFRVLPLQPAAVGILITGNEVYHGLIADRFEPIISAKVMKFGCRVVKTVFVPDDRRQVREGLKELRDAGAELIVTTAGLSVDPDDVTPQGLLDAGVTELIYGAPILPGAMTLLARLDDVPVIAVPGCALYFKTTSFDLLLPRLLAGIRITRKDLARMGNGAMCHECKDCTYPKCAFGK